MNATEIFLVLLLAICVVAYVAKRIGMAYPIAFVLAGIAIASIPGCPEFEIPPDVILLIFLPPLLSEAAYFTSLRDLRANWRPILQLALGLVIATCVSVAYTILWADPAVGLSLGFVLGAIISPPDAVAAVSVTRNVTIPRRIMTILEGESLVNDATGLVLYKFAVAAVVTGAFSLTEASLHFAWMVASGVCIGWAIGWSYMRIFPKIQEMSVEILSTFLAPYACYLFAESVHGSGVLAVVTGGLTMGWYAPQLFKPVFRIPAQAVWKTVTFVLNGLVFLLIGLQFPGLLHTLSDYDPWEVAKLVALMSVVSIGVRIVWVYALTYGMRFLNPKLRQRDPYPAWQNVFIVAWTGMRGVVSLATALALPLYVESGDPFPHRDLIIFLAFAFILVTLILQGLSLPWISRKLALIYDGSILQEQWNARKEATESALKKIEELKRDPAIQSAALERIASHYHDRLISLGDGPNTPLSPNEPPTAENHPIIVTEGLLWKEVLEAERRSVVCLRQTFEISDDVMHEILRDIDLLHNHYAKA